MADSEKRRSLVEGTPDEHADAAAPAYRRARQERINRHWLLYALVLLGAAGYAIYRWGFS
jgi:hypothetical protein